MQLKNEYNIPEPLTVLRFLQKNKVYLFPLLGYEVWKQSWVRKRFYDNFLRECHQSQNWPFPFLTLKEV
jgi:hypothetical protein